MLNLRAHAMCAMVAGALSISAIGDVLLPGLYELHNHPDALIDPPPYGMRLDELYNLTADVDNFTFDFDDPNSAMTLFYDDVAQKIIIDGVTQGGHDVGNVYANDVYKGLYEVHFEYTIGVELAPGDDDLIVDAPTNSNFGTIKTPLGDTFDLNDKSDGNFTFRFGDDEDDNGHRGYDGISGWGWLGINGNSFLDGEDDFIFTATFIPEPSSLLLSLVGAALAAHRRR
jgi:hypothetical protein